DLFRATRTQISSFQGQRNGAGMPSTFSSSALGRVGVTNLERVVDDSNLYLLHFLIAPLALSTSWFSARRRVGPHVVVGGDGTAIPPPVTRVDFLRNDDAIPVEEALPGREAVDA
ncbi:hypothetical protein TSAR_003703, partial [Trichomalopsis sarcophagae]